MYEVVVWYNTSAAAEFRSRLNSRLNELADMNNNISSQHSDSPLITKSQIVNTYIFSSEEDANNFIKDIRELPIKLGIRKHW